MRAKTYAIVSRAVEEGLAYGWNRAHKHDEHPDREVILDHLERAVMNAISEVFDFDELSSLEA